VSNQYFCFIGTDLIALGGTMTAKLIENFDLTHYGFGHSRS
jgi:hypothetical protein